MGEVLGLYAKSLDEYKAGNFELALKIIAQIKILVPNWAKATLLESYIYSKQYKFFSELDALKKCLSQCTDDVSLRAEAISRLAGVYRVIGDTQSAVKNFLQSAELENNPTKKRIEISNAIFSANDSEKITTQNFQKLYAEYQKTFSYVKPFDKKFYHHEKIRVGYLSSNFCMHPVANFIWALINLRDKKNFEIYCYSNTKNFDTITAQIKNSVDFWRDITDVDDATAAKIIRDDEIDILIELGGHTENNRLPVMAYRPASVQISGIGYMNSTGTNFVDYFLTDKFCYVDTAWKNFFTEKPLILPRSHFCYTPLRNFPVIGDAPCITKGYVTFGCFNNFSKITLQIFEAWRKILQQVNNSRLILKHKIFNDADGRETVTNFLEYLGFDIWRVELRGFTANYLEEYRDIDIALDTFPYVGGTTTCEALYMGVPVISLYGDRHGTRFGYSILNNVGIGELAVENVDEYVDRAVKLAGDFETLSLLHKNLRRMMKNSPLMNAVGYVRNIEEKFFEVLKEDF
ncbi:MAG: hypothetical protein IKZ58_09470 [Selenomonadaceae bacterium]|nr:hypothetical protein [Selenomonadaceae bacterium]